MTTDHQGAEALIRAAEVLEREARGLFVCHTHRGRWTGVCASAKADHDEMIELAKALRAWNRRPAPASDLRAAAQAVVDRWDSPQWKDEPHTAEFINRLRRALEAPAGGDGLPELPEPLLRVNDLAGGVAHAFTADQMRQYALDALAARAPQWLPIEQAPKDGTQLLLTNGKDVAQGWWEIQPPFFKEHRDLDGRYIDQTEFDGFEGWLDHAGGMQPKPTHFMPLPAPPSDSAPANDRQALNDKQIMRGWLDWTEPGCSATDAFVAGVRFTEKHHGVAPPSDSAADTVKWCSKCGEGANSFCRQRLEAGCGLNLPAPPSAAEGGGENAGSKEQ